MAKKRILLCTDFSDNSAPAESLAVEYAKDSGASLLILHVIDMWAGFPMYQDGWPVDVQEIMSGLQKEVERKLATLCEDLAKDLPDVQTRWVVGVPAEEIVSAARDESCGLIVMGTHGWSGLRHFFLGSVVERVLRTAECPILVARPKEEAVSP